MYTVYTSTFRSESSTPWNFRSPTIRLPNFSSQDLEHTVLSRFSQAEQLVSPLFISTNLTSNTLLEKSLYLKSLVLLKTPAFGKIFMWT